MRRALLLAIVIGVVVATALPAAAKIGELRRTDVRGPGITGVLRLNDERSEYLMSQTSLFGEEDELLTEPPVAASKLGPAYEVSYIFTTYDERTHRPTGELSTLHQKLYPYARPVPVSFVPDDQVIGHDGGSEMTIPPHWSTAPIYLRDDFDLFGFPPAPDDAKATAASEQGGTAWLWLLVLPVGAGVVVTTRRVSRSKLARKG